MALNAEELCKKLGKLGHSLENTTDWLNPIAWRQKGIGSGFCGLDLPTRVGGHNFSALTMLELFRYCGKIDLGLRDVPGGGHARFITQINKRSHDAFLQNVIAGNAYCGIFDHRTGHWK